MGDALGLDYQSYQYFFLGFCLLIFVFVFIFMARVSGSRFGLALRSLREDERASAAFGRDIYLMKLKAYVLGAAFGGLAGGLFAAYLSAFNPSAWSPIEAIVLYSAVLVGGKGNIKGVVLGVFVMIVLVQESTRFLPDVPGQPNVVPALRGIVIGVVLVLFIRFRPQGLLPERRYIDRLPQDRALDEEADKIAVLNQGADDYLTKPFGVGELLARVQAVLRRASWADTPRSVGTQRFGNIEIDFEQRQVWRDGERIKFTPTEFSLLQELALHPGKIFTHETLLQRVWGIEHSRDAEYLRVYIGRLRRKIETDSSKPLHILTEPGMGYYLVK